MTDQPVTLQHRVADFIRESRTGRSREEVIEGFPEIAESEVRAALNGLRKAHQIDVVLDEGKPLYRSPEHRPDRQAGTSIAAQLARKAAKSITPGSGGEATPPAAQDPAVTGEADASSAAPQGRPARPAKDRPSIPANERESAMPKKKHDTATHRNAIRGSVLKALGSSEGLVSRPGLQQILQLRDRTLSASQMTSALMNLKGRGLAEFEGRGPGIQWRITAKGRKALDEPSGETAPDEPKPTVKRAAAVKRRAAKKPTKKRRPATRPRIPEPQPAVVAPKTPDEFASIASFTSKGSIVLLRGDATKQLDVDESRAIVELVRAFDGAGLMPREDANVEILPTSIDFEFITRNAERIKRALRNA